MNKEQQLIIKQSEIFGEVRFVTIDEKEYAVGKDIAEKLGYKDPSATISKKCKNGLKTTIEAPCQNGKVVKTQVTLIPEGDIYRLIIGSKLPEAEKFESWVMDEVLPDLRKHGAYISNNEEVVDQGYIKYTYGQIKNTFINCPIESLSETYDDCLLWHKNNKTRIPYAKNSKKRSDATHSRTESKIMIMQKIISVLEDRNLLLCESGKFGLVSEIDNTIKQIKDDIKKQYNKSNGGVIANKTKKINKLKEEIEYHNPSFENFIECKTAPISNNAMYEAVSDWETGEPKMVKTKRYNNWLCYFDDSKLNIFKSLDFSKPIYVHAKYIMSKNQDASNFIKPLHDKLATYFEVDDRLFYSGKQEVLGYYDNVKDGRIFLYLCN